MTAPPQLSIAIPSYGREQVLLDSISALLALDPPPLDLLLIDQTANHQPATVEQLAAWQQQGRIRWIRQANPSITAAMNRALLEAHGARVLFLDDDIRPDPRLLIDHTAVAERHPEALIAGRVLQPWHHGQPDSEDALFRFNALTPRRVAEFMGCNVSVPRHAALAIGGFDQNFVRVAYRFEAEFAHRWCRSGHEIHYAPGALIHHLKAERGGTRSYGEHLTTVRPDHAVGRYYFRLRTQPWPQALAGSGRDLVRAVATRHHRRRPWWIPLTLLAELRGWCWALRLQARGPKLLPPARPRLLVLASHPIQYQAPLFRALAADPGLELEVLFLALPTPEVQGQGFGRPFRWDVPLLEGYRWRQAAATAGAGPSHGFLGLRCRSPGRELRGSFGGRGPDAVLATGWQNLGLLQLLMAARRLRLPLLLRMEANDRRPRPWPVRQAHRWLLAGCSVALPIGRANARFLQAAGMPASGLVPAPYGVDNAFFASRAEAIRPRRAELRRRWLIPEEALCFLFAGKLQAKKRPLDLLAALARLEAAPVHLLIVGSGELEPECRRRVAAGRLPVSFAGFLNQEEIPAAYVAADCLVLPSDAGETWGLVVNEAMACGLPAIVSDRAGCAEDLVLPGCTGAVVPCGDVGALASAMAAMAADPAAARRMGAEARRRVQSDFSIEAAAAGIREGLTQALAP